MSTNLLILINILYNKIQSLDDSIVTLVYIRKITSEIDLIKTVETVELKKAKVGKVKEVLVG